MESRKKLKPGDKYTLTDGRVVEVELSAFVLLGLKVNPCSECCLDEAVTDTDQRHCINTVIISCEDMIGKEGYFKWSKVDVKA